MWSVKPSRNLIKVPNSETLLSLFREEGAVDVTTRLLIDVPFE